MWNAPLLANERFIPLELFTGGEIRNDTEIKFTKANKVFGGGKKKIVGPEDWKNPQTGETIKVYKRTFSQLPAMPVERLVRRCWYHMNCLINHGKNRPEIPSKPLY